MKKSIGRSFIIILFLFSISCSVEFSAASWEDGVIPYYLKGSFTSDEIADLEEALGAWESVANVDFIEVTPRSDAYEIRKVYSTGWSSTVGENNIKCYMNFKEDNSSYRYSHILHELGHCLGLYHEHQRPDRNMYINVYYENILLSEKEEFVKKDNPLYIESEFEYDYNSIMHYPEYAFTINGHKTIESNTATPVDRLGIITDIDAEKIQNIYGKPIDVLLSKQFLLNQIPVSDSSYNLVGD